MGLISILLSLYGMTRIYWKFRLKPQTKPDFLVIGIIDRKHWSAVITYRGKNIRFISVRRSRVEEVTFYES